MKEFPFLAKAFAGRTFNKVHFLHWCDYLLFILFCLAFLNGVQADLVSLTLMKVFHLPYMEASGLIVVLLTAVFVGIQVILNSFFHLKGRRHALSFIPSFLLLALFTDLVPDYSFATFIPSLSGLVLFLVLLRLSQRTHFRSDTFWNLLQPNLCCFLFAFFYVALFCNSDEVFHNELKVERGILHGNYKSALSAGEESLATSPLLFSLRACALSCENTLGESLFDYPVPSPRPNLSFSEEDFRNMLFSRDGLENAVSPDMRGSMTEREASGKKYYDFATSDHLLCSLLLDKKLDEFARRLPEFYDISNTHVNLPRHYREALVLYNALFIHPRLIYYSVSTKQNYLDFIELCNTCSTPAERKNLSRRLYGNTFWWYYYFH